MNPLFHLRCPKDSTHQLHVFYPRDGLDPKYVELIKEHPENGCGHDLRQEEEVTQYFCFDCKMSFCGDCAHNSRVKNPNAFKTGQNVTPVEGKVLFRDDKGKFMVDVPKSIVYTKPSFKV